MNFTITSTVRNGVCTVRPRGELDAGNAHSTAVCLDTAITSAALVVVDLSRVTFADCATLSVLLSAARHAARRGRRLVLTEPRPAVQLLLDVFELSSVCNSPVSSDHRTSDHRTTSPERHRTGDPGPRQAPGAVPSVLSSVLARV